ncbi:MAG TPA: NAD(P)/FAD-dependent oxidoreductase [Polyangiales bacterium]|nr:NAD(P)/FAD-dependent oxidoreductase [Polyangiales bacterium]
MSSQKPLSETTPDLRFVIIGAGLSGIMSVIALERAGFRNIALYEKAEGFGGTWRDNTYPGVGCDVPSHLYCYSFAPNPDWSRVFSPGHEILAYIESVAERYRVTERAHFGEEVTHCRYADKRWHIETSRGRQDHADVLIAATGVTHHPRIPELKGIEAFQGAAFHSARWDHSVPIDGRRVGVIGTGSTAVQLVAALVKCVDKLSLFQRSPQWMMPQENAAYDAAQREQFKREPESMRALREYLGKRFNDNFSNAVIDVSSPQLKVIEQVSRAHLENSVADPVLREKLRPNYRAACKRLIISSEFYPAIQQPNAELVVEGIEQIEPKGIRTRDGRLHELDVIVYATGFRTDQFIRPTKVLGRSGQDLGELWQGHPTAYLSVAVPDFPNFFLLNGPSSPVGNFSLIEVAELQMQYALQLVEKIRAGECREVSVKQTAADSFEAERIAATKNTVWMTGCKSWYLDDRGVPASWPWSLEHFRKTMAAPDYAAFELR